MALKQLPVTVISASGAVDQTSLGIDSPNLFYVSAQVVTSGTATGTLKLQFSNDVNAQNPLSQPTNWTDIPSATVTVASAGAAGIPKTDLCYQWVRAVWTHANAGTGTVIVNLKFIGA